MDYNGRQSALRAREFIRSPEGRILICLLAAAPFLLTPWVHGDGIGSVSFLRSVIVDGNLDLSNEFQYLTTHISADAGGLPGALLHKSDYTPGLDPFGHRPQPDPVTGRVPFFASIGPPIAWAPAYFLAHNAVRAGRALGLSHRDDGYGGLYYLAIALTSLACGVAGLLLARRLASRYVPSRETVWAALCVAWASPLLYYLYLAPSYVHSITTLTAGAFFLYWWRNRGATGPGVWFRWGLLAGLLFIARWNDVVLAVPVFALEAGRVLKSREGCGGPLPVRRLALLLGVALAGFALVASVQLGIWQYFHGRPLVRYSFRNLGFWTQGLWGTFISDRHGLFIWTPITIPAVIGLFLLVRRDRELAAVSIAAIALLAVSNCTIRDWWGGAAFGMRRLISATPLFVLGLGVLFDDIRVAVERDSPRWARTARSGVEAGTARSHTGAGRACLAAPVICILFSIWNALLLAQYALGMISHTEPVSFATIATNQPRVVARIIQLIGEIL